ncbi:MAG TPA: SH3 domain-containing protein, partial [Anaerolineales bacterium]
MLKHKSVLLIPVTVFMLACTISAVTSGTPGQPPGQPAQAPSPTTAAQAPTAINTLPPAVACTPQLTANSAANVRYGPGTLYEIVGALALNQVATIEGRNAEGTWWYIVYATAPGGHGWVSGSITSATCVPSGLAIIAPPPTPVVPTGVAAAITNVSVTVDPKKISVPGCMGPIQQSVAAANVTVSGPIKIKWHFETEQNGSLPTHVQNFNGAGTKNLSDSFTPPLTP